MNICVCVCLSDCLFLSFFICKLFCFYGQFFLVSTYHGAVDEPGDGDRGGQHPGHVPDHDAPQELE